MGSKYGQISEICCFCEYCGAVPMDGRQKEAPATSACYSAELLFPLGLNVFLGPEQKSQEEKKKKSLGNIDTNWKVIHEISRIHR